MATIDSLLTTAGIAESAKRQKVAETVEDLLSRMSMQAAEHAVTKNDEKWESRIQELVSQADKNCESKVHESEQRTKSLIDELRTELKGEIGKVQKSMDAAGGKDPWANYSRASAVDVQARHSGFVPTQVDIKGWVHDWSKKREQGLPSTEAMAYLHKVLQASPDVQQFINLEATKAMNTKPFPLSKIEVKVQGGRDACRLVKDTFQQLFNSSEEHFVKGSKPRCCIEPSPEMKPVIVQGAKMLGILERDHGIEHLKPEWGLTLSIYQEKPGSPRLLLAEFSSPSGWTINSENLAQAKSGLTEDVVRASMRA